MDVAKQERFSILKPLLMLLATVQVTWFYLARIPSAFSLDAFESGHAPLPFQHRLAMRPLLVWAHANPACIHTARWLTMLHAWFPHGVRPEALVELPVDILAIIVTGWAAERIYAQASDTQLLRGWVYALTLLMTAVTFDLLTVHNLRFVYDLPAMAFFAAGLYVLYTRQPLWRFALLFACATINRETTLLLLAALLLQQWTAARAWLAALLLTYWIAWHAWVTLHFAANVSAAGPRFWLNAGLLLCPLAWPQLCTFAGLCLWPILGFRNQIRDVTLRRWRMLLPLWIAFMFRYGLMIETRVFGELIPYFAIVTALALEHQVLSRLQQKQRVFFNASLSGPTMPTGSVETSR
jgi:hypothetical protein